MSMGDGGVLVVSSVVATLIGYAGLCRGLVSATSYALIGVANKLGTVLAVALLDVKTRRTSWPWSAASRRRRSTSRARCAPTSRRRRARATWRWRAPGTMAPTTMPIPRCRVPRIGNR